MRRTAGAQIHALDTDKPHRTAQLLFRAIVDGTELRAERETADDRNIAHYHLICRCFYITDVLLGKLAVGINGKKADSPIFIFRHMKAAILAAEHPMRDTGDNMLSGMALHARQARTRVYLACNSSTDRYRQSGNTYDRPAALTCRDTQLDTAEAQNTGIGALTATAGEKSSTVKLYRIAAVDPFDRRNGRVK